jgi:hypothetical protein
LEWTCITAGGEPVDIEVRSQSSVKVIRLRGRLNLGDAVDILRQTFDDLLAASGIGLLVRCLTSAKQSAGAVKLLNPSKFAVQTLKMTGLLNLFEVFDNLDRAVSSFG